MVIIFNRSVHYYYRIIIFQEFRFVGAYSVSKTALFGLTKFVAEDLAPENIRVNCLAPGLIRTKFGDRMLVDSREENLDVLMSYTPLGRVGEPDEMGGVVAFLCSDDASYITGEVIVAAGGMQSRI
ncbi:hypothetical protein M8J77_000907 [Diaphorina citri]|nr:hypothetical protein M8J77_000907 [Diaphorina citri]